MKVLREYSAGGAIIDQNTSEPKVLLIRVRSKGFELPKGHIEKGETPEEAASRECIEEVGIQSKIQIIKKLDDLIYRFEQANQIIEKKVTYFSMKLLNDLVYVKPKETREVRWISEKEIKKLELVNEELRGIILKTFECGYG